MSPSPTTPAIPGVRDPVAIGALTAHQRTQRGYRAFSTVVLLIAGIAVPTYLLATRAARLAAASPVGRTYGAVGTLLFLFLIAYPLRKLVQRGRAGSLERWYRLHVVLGALCLALVACHSGFAFRSWFLIALQVGFWGTILTGVGGWTAQWWLLDRLRRGEYPPAHLEELEPRRKKLLAALLPATEGPAPAATDIPGALEELRRFRARNLWKLPNWEFWQRSAVSLLKDVSTARTSGAAENSGGRMQDEKGQPGMPKDRDDLAVTANPLPTSSFILHPSSFPDAVTVARLAELNEVEVLRSYHRWLRAWPTWHLLIGIFAIQMVAWHIWTVIRFPR